MNSDFKNFDPDPLESPELYAAIYARSSNSNAHNSIESQQSICTEVLHEKKLLLYNRYSDIISATEKPLTARKGFMQMWKDAEKGLFKTIIVFKRDRLARIFSDWIKIKDFLSTHNIKIIYSDNTEFIPNQKDTIGNLVDNIVFGVAAFEPQQLKDRTVNGIKKKKERGEYSSSSILYGYERIQYKKDKKNIEDRLNKDPYIKEQYPLHSNYVLKNNCSLYLPIQEKINIIKKLFNMYLNLEVKEKLNENLLPTINKVKKATEGNKYRPFNSQGIKNIIENPVYCGRGLKETHKHIKFKEFFSIDKDSNDYIFKKDIFQPLNNVIPIIDKETWEKAALLRIKRYTPRENDPTPNIFKNLLYCGNCKNKNGEMKSITISSINYYRCDTPSCFSTRIKDLQHLLMTQIIKDISTHQLNISIKRCIETIKTDIKFLETKLKKEKQEKDQILLDYIENPLNKDIEKKLTAVINKVNNSKKKITQKNYLIYDLEHAINQLEKEKSRFTTRNNIQRLIQELNKDVETSNQFLKSIIEKVVLTSKTKSYEIQYKSRCNHI